MSHCHSIYRFQFCIAAAQNIDCILTVGYRNLKHFLGVREPLRLRSFVARGDHAADVFKRVEDPKKGRYLFYLEIKEVDSSSGQLNYYSSSRRTIKLVAIVEIYGLLDSLDNIIVKERWRIRSFNEPRRVKGPIAEAAVGVGDVVEAPVLVRTEPSIRRARRIGADPISQKRLDPGVKIEVATVNIGAGVLMTPITFSRPNRCVRGTIV